MSRRRRADKRDILPDPKFASTVLSKFINVMMVCGKKSVAEKIVYGALEIVSSRIKVDPLEVFSKAIAAAKPAVEVRSRRVGGAHLQIPVEINPIRQAALAMRWIRDATRKRNEKSMHLRLANELMAILEGTGVTMKKKDEVHRMAEANKAFSHFNRH